MIDYATPEDRLSPRPPSLEARRAKAWAYLNERRISVLRHGFRPTAACATDVAQTWIQATGSWINERGLPSLLRRQAD